jgi:hypothetical protein
MEHGFKRFLAVKPLWTITGFWIATGMLGQFVVLLGTESWVGGAANWPAAAGVVLFTWVAIPVVLLLAGWYLTWIGATVVALLILTTVAVALRSPAAGESEGGQPGSTSVRAGARGADASGAYDEVERGRVGPDSGRPTASDSPHPRERSRVNNAEPVREGRGASPDREASPPEVPLAIGLRGEEMLLREGLGGRIAAPFEDELRAGSVPGQRLVITLRSEQLTPIYGQAQSRVSLSWRWVESASGAVLGADQIVNLTANGPTPDAARTRALHVALDTMMSRIRKAGIVPE